MIAFVFIVCCSIVWVSLVCTLCVTSRMQPSHDICPEGLHAEASDLKSKNTQTLQINNGYLEKTLKVLTNVSSRNVSVVIHMPQGPFEGWVVLWYGRPQKTCLICITTVRGLPVLLAWSDAQAGGLQWVVTAWAELRWAFSGTSWYSACKHVISLTRSAVMLSASEEM